MKRAHACWLVAGVLAVAGCRTGDPADCFTRSEVGGCYHPGDPRLPHGQTLWREVGEAGRTTSSAGGYRDGSRATAAVNRAGAPGIELDIATSSPAAAHGGSFAVGQLGDVIRVPRGGPPPAALRIQVEVAGTVSLAVARDDLTVRLAVASLDRPGPVGRTGPEPAPANSVGGRSADVYLVVNPARARGGCPTYSVLATDAAGLHGAWRPTPAGTARRLAGPSTPAGPVRWTAAFDVPYSPDLGGYRLNLYASAKVCARGGSAAGFRGDGPAGRGHPAGRVAGPGPADVRLRVRVGPRRPVTRSPRRSRTEHGKLLATPVRAG